MINFNRSLIGSLKFWIAAAIALLILAALVAAYFSAVTATRDAQRLNDVKAIQSALQIYFKENGFYPAGNNLSTIDGLSNYLDRYPVPPKASGGCSSVQNQYLYSQQSDGTNYSLTFCQEDGLHVVTAL